VFVCRTWSLSAEYIEYLIFNIYIELQAGNDRLIDRQSNQREREREREREEYKQKRSSGLQQETIEYTTQTRLHESDRQTLARNWPCAYLILA
jgi:hypothetical protein